MKARKLISSILVLTTLLLAAVSCGNTDKPGDTEAPAAATTEVIADVTTQDPTKDENGYLKDDLPETLNYNNKDFKIFTWENQTIWEWSDSDETTGDIIKDSIYSRQLMVEQRMGVKFVISEQNGDWDHRNSFIDAVYANVSAGGSDSFDLIGQYTPASAIGTVRGLYCNLVNIENLDLSKPWWPADITDSGTINGKVYAAAGDISCTLIRNMVCLMINLDLANDLQLEDVYTLVKNKQWTAEKFMTMGTGTVVGLNPDGSTCYTTTVPNNVVYDNIFYAGGFNFVDHTADGIALSEDLTSTRMSDWFDLWCNFNSKEDVGMIGINAANGFTSGSVLFHFGAISDVQNYLQDITFKFGILPYPMYDENQENYATICGYWVTMYSIPTNAADRSMSGAVLECLGSEGYRTITPAVYEVSFKYRFLNSQDNADMFTLLHDTLSFDIGRTMGDQINCFGAFRQVATAGNSWSSYYKSQEKSWNKNIKNVLKAVDGFDE